MSLGRVRVALKRGGYPVVIGGRFGTTVSLIGGRTNDTRTTVHERRYTTRGCVVYQRKDCKVEWRLELGERVGRGCVNVSIFRSNKSKIGFVFIAFFIAFQRKIIYWKITNYMPPRTQLYMSYGTRTQNWKIYIYKIRMLILLSTTERTDLLILNLLCCLLICYITVVWCLAANRPVIGIISAMGAKVGVVLLYIESVSNLCKM